MHTTAPTWPASSAPLANNAAGIAGTCWQVSLMPLKVGDANGVNLNAAVAAIEYAVASGAKIINASWGSTEYSESLRNAIEEAGKKGVLVVAAAGNDVAKHR